MRGYRNIDPTPAQFINAVKSLVFCCAQDDSARDNLHSASEHANCEDDGGEQLLMNLQYLVSSWFMTST